MKWLNLKHNKCPQCDKDWVFDIKTIHPTPPNKDIMIEHGCGFKIRQRRYSQIVISQVTKQLEDELERENGEITSTY